MKDNYWVRWLVGILWGVVVLALTGLINNVIANDKESRNRDRDIECKIEAVCQEQQKTNEEIKIILAEIKTDLKYVKSMVKAK